MPRVWPVVDGQVAIFKKDGGPIDEEFTAVSFPANDIMYRRKRNGKLYAFFRTSNGSLRYWGTMEYDRLMLNQKVNGFHLGLVLGDPNIVTLDPHCYFMCGGTIEADE